MFKNSKDFRSVVLFTGSLMAMCTALYKSMDNITAHNFITAKDSLTAVFSYLVIGGWTGCILSVFCSYAVGKKIIDNTFNKIVFKNRKMHIQAMISGIISALSTLFFLWGCQFGDPGTLIALSTPVMLYAFAYDRFIHQTRSNTIVPLLLALIGSSMAAFNGSLRITITAIILVLILSNGLATFAEIAEQSGVRASDGVNFFIWRSFWIAISGTILSVVISLLRGYYELLISTLTTSIKYIPFVTLTMIFVFIGVGLKLTLKKTYPVSIILLLSSTQVIFAFPIVIVGNKYYPGLFGAVSTDFFTLSIRILGLSLLICSVAILTNSNLDFKK
jgi:hypothetical protein